MKTITLSLLAVAGLVAGLILSSSEAVAQATPAAPAAGGVKKLVDIKKVNVEIQKTPDFNVPNVKQKRFIPKDWLEIEVDCEAELAKDAKDKSQKTYAEVTFKYYAYLSGNPDPKKNRVVTGEVVHTNVPIKEAIHSVMYITPSTILGITEGKPVNPTMIKATGVEVFIGGELVGRKTSEAGNKEWWKGTGLPPQEAAMLDKSKTPFAPLWFDYHLEVRAK
jgi:hypothetical protein